MTRILLVLVSMMVVASASAQIDIVFVTKEVNYEQTDASTTSTITNPYLFSVFIGGTGLTGSDPVSPTIATPAGGTESSASLVFDGGFGEWDFESVGFVDQTALNAAFGDGVYTVQSSSFADIVLNLSNADLFPNAPTATISTNNSQGFQWVSGVLEVNPSLFTTLTITTNIFGTNFNASANNIGILGNNFTSNLEASSFNTPATSLAFDIAASEFITGSTSKSFELEFNNIITLTGDTPGMDATSISAFSAFTTIQVAVVPEPSTYAAILGALALGGVAWSRRRRT